MCNFDTAYAVCTKAVKKSYYTTSWVMGRKRLLVKIEIGQGPLITDGRNSKEMFILPTGLL